MSWRTVVVSSSAKLEYQMGYLIVRTSEKTKIHLSEIAVLIIESTAVSLTAALLNELTKRKIKVIFCDEKRNPSSELISYYGSHDTSVKIRKQTQWSDETKLAVWTNIVSDKIRKQAEHLQKYSLPEADVLFSYLNEIEFGDATNREGHSAKVYFNALFGMSFTRTDANSLNAALNYGYSILLSAFNREIVSNGYITQLGLSHSNMYNQFNLASDLMEPFRPLVDRIVKELSPTAFERDEKVEILHLLQQEVLIGDRHETVLNAIKIYTKSVLDALSDNNLVTIKFYKYEL